MKFSKGKGLLAVLAVVVALTPLAGKLQVSASDTDGLSGVAKVLADATPDKKTDGVRSSVGVADIVTNENEPQLKSVRLASFILREPQVDIEELIENARKKAWESKVIVTVDEDQFVYMRSEPSTEGSILGIMPHGAAGTVIEECGDWSYINSGQIDGYVSNEYLAFGEEALTIAEEICGYVAYVDTYKANVRSGPSIKEDIIATVEEGMYFEVLEQDNGWVKIRYTKGQEAYMSHEVVDVFLATGVAVYLDADEDSDEDVETTVSENDSDSASETSAYDSYEAPEVDYSYTENTNSSTVSESPAEEVYIEPEVEVSSVSSESVFKVTAYCSCATCCGSYSNGVTASGSACTAGRTIAVDPSIIPIGTTVYIDGVPYVAEDTGVSGYRIDVYMSSHVEALNWGVRYCNVTW